MSFTDSTHQGSRQKSIDSCLLFCQLASVPHKHIHHTPQNIYSGLSCEVISRFIQNRSRRQRESESAFHHNHLRPSLGWQTAKIPQVPSLLNLVSGRSDTSRVSSRCSLAVFRDFCQSLEEGNGALSRTTVGRCGQTAEHPRPTLWSIFLTDRWGMPWSPRIKGERNVVFTPLDIDGFIAGKVERHAF